MKWIILLMLALILISGCENSTQTCLRYCVDGKDTTGYDLGEAWDKLKIAEKECKEQCSKER